MARLSIKTKTLKHIFALTGNQCAFPDCEHELFDGDVFVAQVCHIYPANSNWPRFDKSRSDEQNREFSNLLVLCYKHHKIVDNVESPYTAKQMKEIKYCREVTFKGKPVLLNFAKIENIQNQIETFWVDILDVVEQENSIHEMARSIDPKLDVWQLIESIENDLDRLSDINSDTNDFLLKLDETVLPFLQNNGFVPEEGCPIPMFELGYGFSQINWDMRVLGGGNFHSEAKHLLRQLKVRIVESQVIAAPCDKTLKEKVTRLRGELEESVKTETYYD